VTLSANADNLALDEALLAWVDSDPTAACLRFWQSTSHFVVLGRSNREESEVNLAACAAAGIPVYRRATGGGAVIVGPGCLCYSLALPLDEKGRTLGASRLTAELMSRTASGLRRLLPDITVCGTSDLAFNGLKFSGNAQRWQRNAFIHHGTLLFDFDLTICETILKHPSREPEYRRSRRHCDFLTNLRVVPDTLKERLCNAWNSHPALIPDHVLDEARRISEARYVSGDWLVAPRQ
jgi:lipoate-protein ligase A